MTAAMSMTALAAGWQQDDKGWWYQEEDGSYPAKMGKWIDGDGDGFSEFYYFDENGYLLTNTCVPSRYGIEIKYEKINGDGQLVYKDDVTRMKIEDDFVRAKGIDLNFADETYNEYGISRVAIDMLTHSREENAKYGVISENGREVEYSNGFIVNYSGDGSYKRLTTNLSKGTEVNKQLFKLYFDSNHPSDRVTDTAEKEIYLKELQLPVSHSIANQIWDHVSMSMNVENTNFSLIWYCSNRMMLMNLDEYELNVPDYNLPKNIPVGGSLRSSR